MANFPVIWQFLTVVDMDSLASTPGRNAEQHCSIFLLYFWPLVT